MKCELCFLVESADLSLWPAAALWKNMLTAASVSSPFFFTVQEHLGLLLYSVDLAGWQISAFLSPSPCAACLSANTWAVLAAREGELGAAASRWKMKQDTHSCLWEDKSLALLHVVLVFVLEIGPIRPLRTLLLFSGAENSLLVCEI